MNSFLFMAALLPAIALVSSRSDINHFVDEYANEMDQEAIEVAKETAEEATEMDQEAIEEAKVMDQKANEEAQEVDEVNEMVDEVNEMVDEENMLEEEANKLDEEAKETVEEKFDRQAGSSNKSRAESIGRSERSAPAIRRTRAISCNGVFNWARRWNYFGSITASSSYTTYQANQPHQAFSGVPEYAGSWHKRKTEWHSGNGMPQWLTYQLKGKRKRLIFDLNEQPYGPNVRIDIPICKISFRPRAGPSPNVDNDCPKKFKFQGSHNNRPPWFDLAVEDTEQECTTSTLIEMYFPKETKPAFEYYRLWIEEVPGRKNGNKYVVIRDLQFFTYSDTQSREIREAKYAIERYEVWQNWINQGSDKEEE